jgi:hypothetical protein
LQTSDALGAATAQLGPDTRAAVVELNKQGGLSHGKVTRCLESLFTLETDVVLLGTFTFGTEKWPAVDLFRRDK